MSKSILLIDDDSILRYSLFKALSRQGLTVFESYDLHSSQAILEHNVIDYVLLDLQFAPASGLVLAQTMLNQWPQ